MIEEPPTRFPKVMPMTSAIAPQFSAAHPRAAVIFDNLHMTHDIISDILASDTVPPARKREVIYAALDQMQDSTRDIMTMGEWQTMGEMMGGVSVMGGPATGILPEAPTLGAEAPAPGMAGMDHGAMNMGTGGGAVLGHDSAAAPDSMAAMSGMDHGAESMMEMMGPHSGHPPEAPVKPKRRRPLPAPASPAPADSARPSPHPHHQK
jgi:hypothetical protein